MLMSCRSILQVYPHRVLRRFREGAVDVQVALPVREVEVVDMDFPGVDDDFRGMYLPERVVQDGIGGSDVDDGFQRGFLSHVCEAGLEGIRLFFPYQAGEGGKLSAIGHVAIVAPIQDGAYAVILGVCVQGDVDGTLRLPVREAQGSVELLAGILAEKHGGFDELVLVAHPGEIAFDSQPSGFVAEISLEGGVGVYPQGDIEDGRD